MAVAFSLVSALGTSRLAIFHGQIVAALVVGNTVSGQKPAKPKPVWSPFVHLIITSSRCVPGRCSHLLPGDGATVGASHHQRTNALQDFGFTGSEPGTAPIDINRTHRGTWRGAMCYLIRRKTGGRKRKCWWDSTSIARTSRTDAVAFCFSRRLANVVSALRVIFVTRRDIADRVIRWNQRRDEEQSVGFVLCTAQMWDPVIDKKSSTIVARKHRNTMTKEAKTD